MLIHKPLWRDEEIRCLHYILSDKPWQARVSKDGGGEYDKLNRWWWDRFELLGTEIQKSDGEDWKVIAANVGQA